MKDEFAEIPEKKTSNSILYDYGTPLMKPEYVWTSWVWDKRKWYRYYRVFWSLFFLINIYLFNYSWGRVSERDMHTLKDSSTVQFSSQVLKSVQHCISPLWEKMAIRRIELLRKVQDKGERHSLTSTLGNSTPCAYKPVKRPYSVSASSSARRAGWRRKHPSSFLYSNRSWSGDCNACRPSSFS